MTAQRPITFITPVGRIEPEHVQQHVAQSVAAVAAQRSAPVRWIRVLDGIDVIPVPAPGDRVETVTLPSTEPSGTGAAVPRNRALPWMLDGWMTALDADDALLPDAYVGMVTRLEASGRSWAASRCADIDETGRLLPEWPDTVESVDLPAGYFWQRRLDHGDWAWVCAAMVIDTGLARLVGGWPEGKEIRRSEDTAFVSAVTACAPGVWFPEATYCYRKHAQSTTQQAGWRDRPERLDLISRLVANTQHLWRGRHLQAG